MLAPSSVSLTGTFSHALFLFVYVHPPDNRRGLKAKNKSKWSGEANASTEVPQSLASLKWDHPTVASDPSCFLYVTMISRILGGLGASRGTQQNRAKPWPQLLGNLPMYSQKPGHTCILESIGIAWEPEEGALVPWETHGRRVGDGQ